MTLLPGVGPGMRNVDVVSELPEPFDARQMSYPVSSRINHVAEFGHSCTKAAAKQQNPQVTSFDDTPT